MRNYNFRAVNIEGKLVYNVETPMAYLIHKLPVMQQLIVIDKNHKEIYVGDIIQFYSTATDKPEKVRGVVVEDEFGNFAIAVDTHRYHIKNTVGSEVIGNIIENPELIKKDIAYQLSITQAELHKIISDSFESPDCKKEQWNDRNTCCLIVKNILEKAKHNLTLASIIKQIG